MMLKKKENEEEFSCQILLYIGVFFALCNSCLSTTEENFAQF